MVLAGVPLSAVAKVTGHSTLRCAALYGRHAPKDAAKMAILALEATTASTPEDKPGAPSSAVPDKVSEPAMAYHSLVASTG